MKEKKLCGLYIKVFIFFDFSFKICKFLYSLHKRILIFFRFFAKKIKFLPLLSIIIFSCARFESNKKPEIREEKIVQENPFSSSKIEWTEVDVSFLSEFPVQSAVFVRVTGKDAGGEEIARFVSKNQAVPISLDLSALDLGGEVGEKWLFGSKSLLFLVLPPGKYGAFSLSLCEHLSEVEFAGAGDVELFSDALSFCPSLRRVSFSPSASLEPRALSECASLSRVDFFASPKKIAEGALCALPSLSFFEINGAGDFFSESGAIYENRQKEVVLFRFPESWSGGVLSLNERVSDVTPEAALSISKSRVSRFECSENSKLITVDGVLYSARGTELIFYPKLKEERNFLVPSSVRKIRDFAFCENEFLKTIVFPPALEEIGALAFSRCTSLLAAELPPSCEKVGAEAFSFCASLKSAAFLSKSADVGAGAFRENEKLEELTLCSLSNIPSSLCEGCRSLKKINIPKGCQKINERAFFGCEKLLEIFVPAGVEEIGAEAFSGCENLLALELPISCKKIGAWAFSLCSALRSAPISRVKEIGAFAFSSCASLSRVEIGSSCVFVGEGAFRGCEKLRRIDVQSGSTSFRSDGGVLLSFNGASLVAYPAGAREESFSIPIFVTKIEPSAFSGNRFLKRVKIPAGVEELKYDSFEGCVSLEVVSIPGTVKKVGAGAFRNCASLKSAVLSEGVLELGAEAFSSCASLEAVSLPRSLKNVGEGAFRDCQKLKRNSS